MEQSGRMVPYGPARLLTESYGATTQLQCPVGAGGGYSGDMVERQWSAVLLYGMNGGMVVHPQFAEWRRQPILGPSAPDYTC